MPIRDEFGGILEEEPQVDEFGGVIEGEEPVAVKPPVEGEKPFAGLLYPQTFDIPKMAEDLRKFRVGPPVFGKSDAEYELKPGADLQNVTGYPVMPEISVPGIGKMVRLPEETIGGIKNVPPPIRFDAQTPFEPKPPTELPSAEEGLVTPLLNLVPENEAFAPAVVAATSGKDVSPEEKQKRIARLEGVSQSLRDSVNFFTSPLGAATMGMGALPKIAQKAIAAAFAVDMGLQVPKIATRLGEELGKPPEERNEKEIASLITSAITTTGFTAAGALHAVGPAIESGIAFSRGPKLDIEAARREATLAAEPQVAGEFKPRDFEITPKEKSEAAPIIDQIEKDMQSGKRVSTEAAYSAGLKVSTIDDLERLAKLREDTEGKMRQLIKDGKLEEAMKIGGQVQIPVEILEAATFVGEKTHPTLPGSRPMDIRVYPEVRDWLRNNAQRFGTEYAKKWEAQLQEPKPATGENLIGDPYKRAAEGLTLTPKWNAFGMEAQRIINKLERGYSLSESEKKYWDHFKKVTDEANKEMEAKPEAAPEAAAPEEKPAVEGEIIYPDALEKYLGYTPEEAAGTMAVVDALGLDKSKIRITKGGTPAKDALMQLKPKYRKVLQKAIDANHPDAKLFQEALDIQKRLDENKLFWELNPNKSWMESNQEYWKSVDPDLLCQRSEGTDAAVNYLKQVLGKKYTSSMAWEVIARANEQGLQTPCPQCYVFSARAKSGGAMQKKYIIGVGGYNGEILRTKDNSLATITKRALRHYSSTDFKAEHIPGLIAETIDMANRKLPSAAYSKQGDLAIIFGPAGMHVNLSVGRNDLVGMPMREALELRAKHKNVATVYVSFTDAETIAALKNPLIDHVIPWHGSSQKRTLLAKRMGISPDEIVDYQKYEYKGVKGNYQNETKPNGSKARRQIKEWEHGGDLLKYLALVEKHKLVKKFPQIYDALKAEGKEDLYMKLIGPEYGKHGGVYPYEPVTKNFDLSAVDQAMKNRLRTRLASNKEFIDIARDIAKEVNDGVFEPAPVKPEVANGPFREMTAEEAQQLIDPSKTSRKQIPSLFKRKVFEPAGDNLDIGAGKYDLGTEYLKKERGVDSVPFDPFNRSADANREVIDAIVAGRKFGSVTVPNVLNVIDSAAERLNVITQAARVLKPGGKAYFQIYEGKEANRGKPGKTRDGWQNNMPTDFYLDAISQRFNKVEKVGNVIVASDPKPNIPVAKWRATPGAIYEMFQGKKASVEFKEGGIALIRALENPDVSSGIHEIAHIARRFLLDRNVPPEERVGITDEHIAIAENWAGVKDGKWTLRAEEKFSRGFEKYLRDGKAPTPGLARVFEMFKNWLTKVYRQLKGSPINITISPEMRGVYDALMGRGEALGIKPTEIPGRATPPPIPQRPSPIGETGLKHAVDELERVSYGFKDRPVQDRQDMAEAWARSQNVIAQNPMAGRELAQALIENPSRGLTGDESALLLRHKVALENAVNSAAEKLLTAEGEAKVEAKASFERNNAELNAFLDAVAIRGSEWGREGRWRQALAYEDYSFATQGRLLAAAKGRPLTMEESTKLQADLLDFRTKLDAFERWKSERTQREIDTAVGDVIEQLSRGGLVKEAEIPYSKRALEVADRLAQYWDQKADTARENLRKKFARTSGLLGGADPTILKDVVVIGIAKLMRGVSSLARWRAEMIKDLGDPVKDYLELAWKQSNEGLNKEIKNIEKTAGAKIAKKVKEKVEAPSLEDMAATVAERIQSGEPVSVSPMVRKMARTLLEDGLVGRDNLIDAIHNYLKVELPEITRSEVMQMISGYGEYRMLPKDAVSVLLRGYKGEMQQLLKLEDMAKGEAPKRTGGERRTPTDEERRILKEVEDAKKKGGFVVTDPATQLRSALQSAKTLVQNQIKDLQYEISKKEKILKKKNVLEPDQELLDLRAKRDELRKLHDDIFGRNRLTDEQRVRMVEASLDKQIADIEEQLATGSIFPSKARPQATPTTPGIDAKRLRLAELKLERYYQREQIQPTIVPEVREANRLAASMQAIKTRLEKQIQDLEAAISKRQKIVKEPTKLKYDEEANRLKEMRDDRRKLYDEIFPREPISDERRLELWKARTEKKINELNDRIERKDYSERPKRPELEKDEQANKLQTLLDEAKEKFRIDREKAEWESMSPFQKTQRGAANTYDAARMLMTTGEFSFVLRQGKWAFLSHPLLSVQALPKAFRAMKNWRTAHEIDLQIFNHPEYRAAKAAKLHLVDEGASLTRMEELYVGRWAHAIPVVSAFNRAARVFLNKIRFDNWMAMRKSLSKTGTPTKMEDSMIATFVNESTGRGSLGFAEQAAIPLGRVFFAPRYMVSRFQLLTGHSMWKGNARTRMVIAREYARSLVGLALYYTLLNMAFSGNDKKKPVSFDSRSSDFGKIRIGNTRIDPLAGIAQVATFIGRSLSGETKTQSGRVLQIRKPKGKKQKLGEPTWTDVAGRFVRSKLHPVPGSIVNLFTGTSLDGSETSFLKETGNISGPITYGDIYTAFKEFDLPEATALSLLAFLGEGLQTYGKKKQ